MRRHSARREQLSFCRDFLHELLINSSPIFLVCFPNPVLAGDLPLSLLVSWFPRPTLPGPPFPIPTWPPLQPLSTCPALSSPLPPLKAESSNLTHTVRVLSLPACAAARPSPPLFHGECWVAMATANPTRLVQATLGTAMARQRLRVAPQPRWLVSIIIQEQGWAGPARGWRQHPRPPAVGRRRRQRPRS